MVSDAHGSAKWMNDQGGPREKVLKASPVIFGYAFKDGKGDKNNFIYNNLKRHFLSIAPTRSGKGTDLIIPNLLHYDGSCLVIDPKGENAWITAKHRREKLGQKTIILDPWGEVNRRYGDLAGEFEEIASFNPLSILDPESPHYADDIAYLADALIINQGKDPHWDDSARELVAGLMAYCVESDNESASLPLVRVLLSKPAEDIAEIARKAQKFGFESVAARKLGRFSNDSREIASIVSTALTQTAFLDSKTLSENLNKSTFSFDDLVNGYATVYLVLPVDKLQTYGRWLRLMVSIGIRTVARNVEPLDLPVLFILDEFGTIGRLSAVAQAYGLMAGLQMRIWAFVQDLMQLKRDYPEDWETFIGNSETVTFFNVMDQFTAEYVSRLLGTETRERVSQLTGNIREGGLFSTPKPEYLSMNDSLFARALMQPAEVRKLREDLGILVERYLPSLFVKAHYYEDEYFLSVARIDPHFPEMQKKKTEILEKLRKEKAEKDIPDYNAAVSFLEKRDLQVQKGGMLSKKTVITTTDGKGKEFKTQEEFIEWARSKVKLD